MGARTASARRRTYRPVAVALLAALTMTACTIQEDGGPRIIPEEQQGQFSSRPTGDIAAGSTRIFLVSPGSDDEPPRLRSVLRGVPNVPQEILESLLAGQNAAEQENGLSSALPDGLELNSARLLGRRLTIDVSDAINELTPEALPLAVAQLVATATEIDGVENVRLQINGENQVWPLGNRENTDALLTIYDYPGFVESSQANYPAIPTPI